MTRADLFRGDQPQRVVVKARAKPRRWATWAAVGLVVALGVLVPVLSLYAALGAAWALWRPSVALEGGRRPLSTTEWLEWVGHLELDAAEREHEARKAKG